MQIERKLQLMIEQKEHFHGSDLEKIEKIYGIKKENIVSFAANVNPLGESGKLKTALSERIDAITKYPDREYTSLRKAIGSYCKCDYNHITVGNGCTELISLFIQITAPKKTLLLGPTYSEYERDLRINGSDISYHFLKERMILRLIRMNSSLQSQLIPTLSSSVIPTIRPAVLSHRISSKQF